MRLDPQRALGIELQFLRTLEAQADGRRFGAGGEDEVVFQVPLVAVVDEVHALGSTPAKRTLP